MALIGKIREKSVLLVIIIGVALLAFIMTDWKSFSGGDEDQIGYGKIAGESVDFAAYEEAANNFSTQDKNAAAQQQREFTQKDQDASNDKAWSYIVESTIINKEIDALGLNVGEEEFDAYLYGRDGFPILADLAQNFIDSLTGQFDPKLLALRIDQMENSANPEEKKGWEDSKKYYTDRRKQEKYFALLNQGVYVTKLEAEEEYFANKNVKSIAYVTEKYFDIDDAEIKITDEDLKAYYETEKEKKKYFTKSASREVKFFDVKIEPSNEDIAKFNKSLSGLTQEFKTAEDDSAFVFKNSDPRFRVYSSGHQATFVPEGNEKARGLTYPASMDSVFANASIGQVVGPYQDGENTRIAKVMDFNTKLCKVRHILLSAAKTDSVKVAAVRPKADSILRLVNAGNFESFVNRFSEDPGSKEKGGVYDNFLDFEMVKEFADFAANEPIGKIGMVETQFGFHIIEVLDRTAVKYPVLAVVQKTMKPSQETMNVTEQKVYDILYEIDEKINAAKDNEAKIEAFDTLARAAGYFVRPTTISESKPIIYGFNTKFAEDKMIKLAYQEDVKVGTLCGSPIKDKDRYVIAMVSAVKEKGVPALEDIEASLRSDLIKDKKANRFIAKMNGEKSLEALAAKTKSTVEVAEVTFSAPQINKVGFEPEIIGAVFSGLKDGQNTVPLQGRNGVYVVRINKSTKAPATTNYAEEREKLLIERLQSAPGTAKAALLEKSDVIDNRRFMKIGLRR